VDINIGKGRRQGEGRSRLCLFIEEKAMVASKWLGFLVNVGSALP
jgi:hypothetical protein